MRSGKMSELVKCIENISDTGPMSNEPTVFVAVREGLPWLNG